RVLVGGARGRSVLQVEARVRGKGVTDGLLVCIAPATLGAHRDVADGDDVVAVARAVVTRAIVVGVRAACAGRHSQCERAGGNNADQAPRPCSKSHVISSLSPTVKAGSALVTELLPATIVRGNSCVYKPEPASRYQNVTANVRVRWTP